MVKFTFLDFLTEKKHKKKKKKRSSRYIRYGSKGRVTGLAWGYPIGAGFGDHDGDADDGGGDAGGEDEEDTNTPELDTDINNDEHNLLPDQSEDDHDEAELPQSDDPDRQGILRHVDGARLVYKRADEDGSFQELWIYNIDKDMRGEQQIRDAILAGTDILPGKVKSPDGSQSYIISTIGNAQMVHIKGLPN